jgi:hypothetical protein
MFFINILRDICSKNIVKYNLKIENNRENAEIIADLEQFIMKYFRKNTALVRLKLAESVLYQFRGLGNEGVADVKRRENSAWRVDENGIANQAGFSYSGGGAALISHGNDHINSG